MEPYMCWLFLIVFVFSNIPFASGRAFKSGAFKYLHRHPKLKSCAVEVLKENVYVGCRVHVEKGGCEGLNHSWAINQTIESGYAYAKKQWVESSYIPPVEVGSLGSGQYEDIVWDIPGVFSAGSKVETTVTVNSTDQTPVVVLALTARDMNSRYLGSFNGRYTAGLDEFVIVLDEKPPEWRYEVRSEEKVFQTISTEERKIKITFMSLTGSLMILVEDKAVHLKNLTVDLTSVKDITVSSRVTNKGTKFHGFKFTGV